MSADLADLRAWLAELSPNSTEALFDTRAVRALLAERDALAEPEGHRCQTRAGALVAALGIGIPEGTRCVLRGEHAGWHVAPDGATWHGAEPKAQISEPAARALAACRGEVAYLTDTLTLERAEARIGSDREHMLEAEVARLRHQRDNLAWSCGVDLVELDGEVQ